MMIALGVRSVSDLSPVIRDGTDENPRSPSWTNVYRELNEWAVLLDLTKMQYGSDTLIIFDGFLRSKIFKGILFRNFGTLLQNEVQRHSGVLFFSDLGRISWIITSPPYYGLTTYRQDQWLREWFLGGPCFVDYSTKEQISHFSQKAFAEDIGRVFARLIPFCSKTARLVMRFGSINDRPVDALKVVKLALLETGWNIDTIKSAGVASAGKRQLGGFATTERPARSEFDVWCSLA